jgi:signal transduction histidine kinase/ActR/RegA family two-component response regulator
MNLSECWTELESVPANLEMHKVFDVFARNRGAPFLVIVDLLGKPVGVVREHDLKEYAYGRFGRELVKRQPLDDFVRPSLVLPHTVSREDLLTAVASNQNPDGLVLTKDGIYLAVLLNNVVLRLFDANRAETQVRLVQAQKMEAIGTMAGGIAHDLNNILTPIIGYARLMREMLGGGELIDTEMVEQILVSGIRAQETVGRILAFSRHQKTEQRIVALSDVLKEVLRLIGGSLPTTIETELCLETAADAVFANPTELHQVIMNLCTNAYHAMREKGGHLRLSISDHDGPLLGWSVHQGPLSDSMVRLTVKDTGGGIPAEILPKIFDPFFTTKKQGEGTGLGLAIVHGVVTRCGGAVSVESAVGQGTAFHVYLPRHNESAAAPGGRRGQTEPLTGTSVMTAAAQRRVRVLYVDDEFQLSRLAQRYLTRLGLAVETENDSTKAMTTLMSRIQDFDVLVTDQTMPSISGFDLARRTLELHPQFPIILCTGYSETVSPEMAKAAGIRGYLHKPTDYAKMAELIRSCHSSVS